MKNKIAIIMVALFCLCGNSAKTQNLEREALIDSIANISLAKSGRIKMIESATKLIDKEPKLDPVVAEAIFYSVSKKMVRPVVAESYNNLTEEQLWEVIHFMNSEANRRILSNEVAESLGVYLVADLFGYMASMVGGTSWKPEIPSLKDK